MQICRLHTYLCAAVLLTVHSSEKRGLRSTFLSSETLQNLLYSMCYAAQMELLEEEK